MSPDPYTRVGGESEPCHLARKQARPATLYLCSICICMQFVSVFKLFLCSICICVKFAYVCNSVKFAFVCNSVKFANVFNSNSYLVQVSDPT